MPVKLKVSKCFVFVDLFFVDASRWEQGAIWGSDAPSHCGSRDRISNLCRPIVACIYLLGFVLSHDHTYALAHVMLLVKPNAFHSFFNELIIFRFQAHGPGSLNMPDNPFTRVSSACRSKTPIGMDLSYPRNTGHQT